MDEIEAVADMFPKRVGERLADERKAQKLDLPDIATRTRIPLRHLQAIEEGRYHDLPATAYCTGFTKAYARVLGLDEVAYARDVRAELEELGNVARQHEFFEPADPARVPPRTLVWVVVVLALLMIGGYGIFRSGMLDGLGGRDPLQVAAGTESVEVEATPSEAEAQIDANQMAAAPAQAAASASTAVVLTATQPVWLRIYEDGGTRLFEKEMQPGETYQVPDNANNPKILTGRPDALKVTVGGREVAPLGPPQKTISDVGVSAAALAARPAAAVTPVDTPAPSAAPTRP